jgi:hypothetical protein
MSRAWVLLLVALVAFAASTVVVPGVAQAAGYPGGKRIYAVTVGAITPDGSATSPFARLAMYYFNGDGTVTEAFWFWNFDTGYPAAPTKATAAGTGCDGCTVRTAGGFETGAPAKPLSGRYTTTGSTVAITWDGGVTETWAVSTPAPGLSAISLTGSSYGANVGQGYGSNVTAATFVPLSKVPRHKYLGRTALVTPGDRGGYVTDDSASGLDLTAPGWKQCNGQCLSLLSPASSKACTACADGKPGLIRYYLASEGGRRNFYEHFCTCLVGGKTNACYGRGSHLKPQLQVIDDAGVLRGWVGVEASNQAARQGTLGVHWHVDV